MVEHHPDILDQTIDGNIGYQKHLIKNFKVNTPPVTVGLRECASLLMNRSDLSQRGYNSLKKVMATQNVILESYSNVQSFIKSLDIGKLLNHYCDCSTDCFSCSSGLQKTLKIIFRTHFVSTRIHYPSEEQQRQLFIKLKELNSELYGNLDPSRRTVYLRSTGDNFRAAAKYPTEQISYSILNLKDLLHSPYGQFIQSLWRGSESRQNIEIHVKGHYEDLKTCVLNGISVQSNGAEETFNVVVFFCADLSFLKSVFGKCSRTSMYGCFMCKKHIKNWDEDTCKLAETHSMKEMTSLGKKALEVLGENPLHYMTLLDALETPLSPPCGLHLILAHHRYLWSFMFDIIVRRKQEGMVSIALKTIGCYYLSYQLEC